MIITMILIFVFGYLCIALEHKLRIDKAAIALLMCGALWTGLSLLGIQSTPITIIVLPILKSR